MASHLVSSEIERLEPVVTPEGALLDVGDVVARQVQLHQDLEVHERVAADLLQEGGRAALIMGFPGTTAALGHFIVQRGKCRSKSFSERLSEGMCTTC